MVEAKVSKNRGQNPSGAMRGTMSVTSVAAPVSTGRTFRFGGGMGISDLRAVNFAYQMGYVWIGNGTLGTNDNVYFADSSATYTVTGVVPILPADATLGASYITNVWKQFARVVYHRIRVHIMPVAAAVSSSTTIDVVLAPFRGGSGVPVFKTDTTAGNSAVSAVGFSGAVQFDMWQGISMDITKFIAGGSGTRQNEFNVASSVASTSETATTGTLIAPCGLFFAGDSTGSSYRGFGVGRVYVEILVDLLDFTGGYVAANPGLSLSDAMRDVALRVSSIRLSKSCSSSESSSHKGEMKKAAESAVADDHFAVVRSCDVESDTLPLGTPTLLRQPARAPTQVSKRP